MGGKKWCRYGEVCKLIGRRWRWELFPPDGFCLSVKLGCWGNDRWCIRSVCFLWKMAVNRSGKQITWAELRLRLETMSLWLHHNVSFGSLKFFLFCVFKVIFSYQQIFFSQFHKVNYEVWYLDFQNIKRKYHFILEFFLFILMCKCLRPAYV